jgi:hypothetical protein
LFLTIVDEQQQKQQQPPPSAPTLETSIIENRPFAKTLDVVSKGSRVIKRME